MSFDTERVECYAVGENFEQTEHTIVCGLFEQGEEYPHEVADFDGIHVDGRTRTDLVPVQDVPGNVLSRNEIPQDTDVMVKFEAVGDIDLDYGGVPK